MGSKRTSNWQRVKDKWQLAVVGKSLVMENVSKVQYVATVARSVVFQVLLYLWIIFVLTLLFPAVFFEKRFLFKIFRFLTRSALFLMKYILRITCRFENISLFEEVFKQHGPFIIACKHQSGFETVIFSLFFENFNIVAKEEMKKVPLIGNYMKSMDFIFIERKAGRKAVEILLEKGKESMQNNRPLLIFPEGSRAEFGTRGKYHVGVALLYEKLNVPVIPVALNVGAVWPKKSMIKFPGTVTIRVLPPILPGLDKLSALQCIEESIENACAEIGSGRPLAPSLQRA
ncbi:MAG: 1-acyl-sn-glycerol-3-phosphate acyltransferase [Holosporales bacterium]|jgi:1-acyl-sn-glycerol-3-phosphate acyltransferase|nr:1-acyl-sn-glycerol-3-phosphate acyltransferase [Holosporales bacterium]